MYAVWAERKLQARIFYDDQALLCDSLDLDAGHFVVGQVLSAYGHPETEFGAM
jgi:hypothetical protein